MIEAKFEAMLDQFEEELEGAETYIKCAASYKTEMPEFMDNYLRMAGNELEHANHLHNMIEKMMDKYPDHADLRAVWNWQCERLMRWMTKIRTKMEMVKK